MTALAAAAGAWCVRVHASRPTPTRCGSRRAGERQAQLETARLETSPDGESTDGSVDCSGCASRPARRARSRAPRRPGIRGGRGALGGHPAGRGYRRPDADRGLRRAGRAAGADRRGRAGRADRDAGPAAGRGLPGRARGAARCEITVHKPQRADQPPVRRRHRDHPPRAARCTGGSCWPWAATWATGWPTCRRPSTRWPPGPACDVTAVSPVYETAPVGGPDQPDYLNAVLVAAGVAARRGPAGPRPGDRDGGPAGPGGALGPAHPGCGHHRLRGRDQRGPGADAAAPARARAGLRAGTLARRGSGRRTPGDGPVAELLAGLPDQVYGGVMT